jgi:hypothetical protein
MKTIPYWAERLPPGLLQLSTLSEAGLYYSDRIQAKGEVLGHDFAMKSFLLRQQAYLLEAKYVKELFDGSDYCHRW